VWRRRGSAADPRLQHLHGLLISQQLATLGLIPAATGGFGWQRWTAELVARTLQCLELRDVCLEACMQSGCLQGPCDTHGTNSTHLESCVNDDWFLLLCVDYDNVFAAVTGPAPCQACKAGAGGGGEACCTWPVQLWVQEGESATLPESEILRSSTGTRPPLSEHVPIMYVGFGVNQWV
jgi:hypothetical protein